VSARRLLDAVQAALSTDGDLLDGAERAAVDQEMKTLQGIVDAEEDSDVLRRAVDHAAKATDDFAQKRMNASIQKALTGKSVSEI
jgi:molecular chaperone HscA